MKTKKLFAAAFALTIAGTALAQDRPTQAAQKESKPAVVPASTETSPVLSSPSQKPVPFASPTTKPATSATKPTTPSSTAPVATPSTNSKNDAKHAGGEKHAGGKPKETKKEVKKDAQPAEQKQK